MLHTDTVGKVVKVAIVLAGYVVAIEVANVTLLLYQLATQGPDAQASAGMYAFGDFTLYVTVFCLMALIPTGLGLWFLRSSGRFWNLMSKGVLAFAMTGPPAALVLRFMSGFPLLSALAFFRVFAAPLLYLGFMLCAFIARERADRRRLFVATLLELLVTLYLLFSLFVLHRLAG